MTDTRKYLKPAEGRTVRRESGEPWPEKGDWTELSVFVRRRLDDRDLIEADPPTEAQAEQQPEATPPSKPDADPQRKPKGDPKPEAEK